MSRSPISSRNVIDKSRKSSKLFKCKKSFSAAGHKSTSNTIIQDRLMGGADISEAVENRSGVVTENIKESASTHAVDQEKDTSNLQNGRPATSGGPCCSCIAQVPGAIGDQKVDEMIDFVHQNLQEAGKALATLSENFEHDSKLMFVDILGRIQQWTSSVEKKLEDCKKALELMRKELMARLCEIENLKKQLTDCEAARNTEREKQQVSHQTQHQMQHQTQHQMQHQTQVEQHVEERAVVTETPKEQESVLIPVVEQRIKEPVDQFVAQSPAAQEPKVIEIVCTDAAIQSTMKDKERMRREIELEAEITRLKKENQRIVKERAEYENAIQRALLRGVSCLNVEALRVLRSPPIPCCTPCTPCPTDNTEPTVCKKDVTNGMVKGFVSQRNGNGKCVRELSTVKRPCGSPCCSAGRNRKSSSSNSMVFLLHQGDAENICASNETSIRVCGQPVMKKIEIPPCPKF